MERFQDTKFKYTQRVLKEMCKLAKVEYSKVNFHKPDWFLKTSWTDEQESKFKKWMIKYLKTNKKASGRHNDLNDLEHLA